METSLLEAHESFDDFMSKFQGDASVAAQNSGIFPFGSILLPCFPTKNRCGFNHVSEAKIQEVSACLTKQHFMHLLCRAKKYFGEESEAQDMDYKEGDLIMRTMRWGLVPFYTKAESAKEACKVGFKMINAR